jgi:hypothetical protein
MVASQENTNSIHQAVAGMVVVADCGRGRVGDISADLLMIPDALTDIEKHGVGPRNEIIGS